MNFGIVYGQTAYGLADELGVTMQRAEELLAAHAAAYPGVVAWIASVHQQAYNVGEVRTFYGRRRSLPNIYSASDALASEARRQAVNTIVQGSAADLMKLALVRLHNDLPDGVQMLLPVHDSILLSVPKALVEETRPDRNHHHGNRACWLQRAAEGRGQDRQDVGRWQMKLTACCQLAIYLGLSPVATRYPADYNNARKSSSPRLFERETR